MKKIFLFATIISLSLISVAQEFNVSAEPNHQNSNGTYSILEKALLNANDVKVIDIEKLEISTFLSKALLFPNIEEINFNFAKSNDSFSNLITFKKLHSIAVFHSNLKRLPDNIGENLMLTKVTFRSCDLIELPKSFFMHSQFEKIILEGNRLDYIYDSISKNNNLKILSLASNQLNNLPSSLPNLYKLEFLNLSNNNFTETPKQIFKLNQLKVLNLSFNKITIIPKEIKYLNNLEVLYINQTMIKNLPKEIKKLKKLTSIYMNNFNISDDELQTMVPPNCNIIYTNERLYHSLEF